MLSCSICSETVSTLLVGSLLQNYNGSCTTPIVICSENGRFTVLTQEYDFQIEYKKGSQNGNADALSRHRVVAITYAGQPLDDMRKAQRDGPTISMIYETLLSKKTPTHFGNWRQHPLRRYQQLWSQLDG